MANLIIADCTPIFAKGLKHLVQDNGHIVVGEAASSDEAIRQIRMLKPDAIMIDMQMSDGRACDVIEYARANQLPIMLIANSMQEALRAQALGADCVTDKRKSGIDYLECLKTILSGEKCYAFSVAEDCGEAQPLPLSKREIEIAGYVLEGKRNDEIAQIINITTGTVKVHLSRIFKKLKIRSRLQLVLFMQKHYLN